VHDISHDIHNITFISYTWVLVDVMYNDNVSQNMYKKNPNSLHCNEHVMCSCFSYLMLFYNVQNNVIY